MNACMRMRSSEPRTLITVGSSGFGEPWISGTVNLMQGKVDLKFRVTGSKGTYYRFLLGGSTPVQLAYC
jgi:hypothetical protein